MLEKVGEGVSFVGGLLLYQVFRGVEQMPDERQNK